jgi:hypothetical protein
MRSALVLAPLLIAACGPSATATQYGYSRSYVYASGEAHELTDARTDLDPARLCADSGAHLGMRVSWFGIVTRTEAAPTSLGEGWQGAAYITLRHRDHLEPHQCAGSDDSSCRVTVTLEDGPPFRALVRLAYADWYGTSAVAPGSVMRIYGTVDPASCHDEAGVTVRASFYRLWPHGQYFERWPQRE